MQKIRILTELSPAHRKPQGLNSIFRLTHVLCQEWSCRYFLRHETKNWSHFTLSCCYIAGIPTTLFFIWGKPSCFLYETVSCLLCVFWADRKKTRWPPWPLIGWDIFDFSSEIAEGNSTKLNRKQDLNILYQVCVFEPIGKTRWPPLTLMGWDIFDFFSETAEQNSMKVDRKQDLNFFYQVCVFRTDRKNKMAALASDWLRHFRLLLWNRWTELNESWQEARSQLLLPSLCFSDRSEKKRWPPWPLIG